MTRIALAPCAPFSVSDDLMRRTAELAREHGVRLHTHLAETQDEERYCLRGLRLPARRVPAPPRLARRRRLARPLRPPLDRDEIAPLRRDRHRRRALPLLELPPGLRPRPGAGRCSTPGVPVGLGVDGSASNDTSNMLAEARQALLAHRPGARPERWLTAEEVLWMATRGGARCLGRDDIGSLEPGKAADLILVDTRRLSYAGAGSDLLAALVFSPLPRARGHRDRERPGRGRRRPASGRRRPEAGGGDQRGLRGPAPGRRPEHGQGLLPPEVNAPLLATGAFAEPWPTQPSVALLFVAFLFVASSVGLSSPAGPADFTRSSRRAGRTPSRANRTMRAATVKWRPACSLEAFEATTVPPASKMRWPSWPRVPCRWAGARGSCQAPVDLPNLLDLQALDLGGITLEDGDLLMGATVTLQDVLDSEAAHQATAGLLPAACRTQSASRMVRGMATLAGEAVEGAPDSAVAAALLALNAIFVIAHPDEPRESPALRFVRQPLDDLRGGGLVQRILIPGAPDGAALERAAVLPSAPPLALVAVTVAFSGEKCSRARIALAGLPGRPHRVLEAEALIERTSADEEAIGRAAVETARWPRFPRVHARPARRIADTSCACSPAARCDAPSSRPAAGLPARGPAPGAGLPCGPCGHSSTSPRVGWS